MVLASDEMEPFEFVIPQRPVSQQARRRERVRAWTKFVAECARKAMDEARPRATKPVSIGILFLYDEVAIDVDNIPKPILDGLKGFLIEDDAIVTDLHVRCRRRGTTFTLNDASSVLAKGLQLGNEFVYVTLRDAPAQDILP